MNIFWITVAAGEKVAMLQLERVATRDECRAILLAIEDDPISVG